ncbi:MAG: 50S ribosomal protein L9 [Alphaproteobacteria bacterium]|nr:50S ribosomal protein L9 [Alphaproteobacteria bacterium SS10]
MRSWGQSWRLKMLDVILLERIENLGQMGDVVKVKPGYARNFLLPQGKALRANDENRSFFDSQRKELEARNLKRRQEAEAVGEKLNGQEVILVRQAGEAGQLYGSVTARDVADALNEAGFKVGRSQVVLNDAIKMIGLFDIRVTLHPEVAVTVSANVARSSDEATLQREAGGALIRNDEGELVTEEQLKNSDIAEVDEDVIEAISGTSEEASEEAAEEETAEAATEEAASDAEEENKA